MAEAIILDVGHGNACVFVDDGRAVVVDAGPGDLIARTLIDAGVEEIDALVISHRHHDHTSELPSLLSNPELRVDKLFINQDKNRRAESPFERDLRAAFRDSYGRHGTQLQALNETLGPQFSLPNVTVDVLWPSSDLALAGIGAQDEEGLEVQPHTMAGVLRLGAAGRSVLLCADINHREADELIRTADLRANVLVYPHHGGLSGAADDEGFARRLTEAVDPELVVFSHGRTRHRNPRPEVVRGVRTARKAPPVRVLCTQLSRNCAQAAIAADDRLDPTLDHAGMGAGHSCGGSMRISLSTDEPLLPRGAEHLNFVLHQVEGNLCLLQEDN